jgi:hypothetical protein
MRRKGSSQAGALSAFLINRHFKRINPNRRGAVWKSLVKSPITLRSADFSGLGAKILNEQTKTLSLQT